MNRPQRRWEAGIIKLKDIKMKHRSCYTEMMFLGGCFKPKIFIDKKKQYNKMKCRKNYDFNICINNIRILEL